MHPQGQNPVKVQSQALKGSHPARTPLVLIHDGGGTTFGYWLLGHLQRDVWALHNPHFWSGQPWEGGIDAMARHYIGLIFDAGIRGPILLGGWSLGGYLSIVMSRLLAERHEHADITISGLLLIDSPYHTPWAKNGESMDRFPEPVLPSLPPLVKTSFKHCDKMLPSWVLPTWDGPFCGGQESRITAGGRTFQVKCGMIPHKPTDSDWVIVNRQRCPLHHEPAEPSSPPPAILVRCNQYENPVNPSEHPCRVDKYRGDPLLGWEQSYHRFIKAVIDVDSGHYGLFNAYNREQVVNTALDMLESLEAVESSSTGSMKDCEPSLSQPAVI
ncbi:secondary metabolism biosynthetic enzyme [Apiospora phragmitis]|uniref:Secondary metabolism biosynthetic enzyme n=1 Tax=Apiospora phragmitis TaxID=2905665 RepID=A0ABR1T3W2_9PEZI